MATIVSNNFSADVVDVIVNSATFHSIGIKWGVPAAEDTDYNATVAVRYRKLGAPTWSLAMGLFRQDYAWYYGTELTYANRGAGIQHFAGSIMFLTPGTVYEVELTYNDPDGTDSNDGIVYTFETTTRALPVKPTGGNEIFVDNSWGGPFNGTDAEPYNTIQLADQNASPGDIVKIRTGSGVYTNPDPTDGLTTAGTADNWIVYQPDTGHSPVLNGIGIEVGYIWFDGLMFTYDGPVGTYLGRQSNSYWDDAAIYVAPPGPSGSTDNVIVTGCTMSGFLHSVHNLHTGIGWVVMDNDMTGHWPVNGWIDEETSSSNGYAFLCGGEGIEGGPNHIFAYNTVTRHTKAAMGGDAPSQLGTNCDAYGNKVYDTLGTPISFDASYENMRLWGNILAWCGAFSLTFQPQKSGPWYFLYNQVTLSDNQNYKWSVQDRSVIINNTFVPGNDDEAQQLTRCFVRNNLFLTEQQFVWTTTDRFASDNNNNRESNWFTSEAATPKVSPQGWEWMGDVDYDGFDWGGGTNIVFRWNYDAGTARTDFSGPDPFTAFYAEVGMEQNGIEVDADLIFEDKTYSPNVNLVLKSDAAYGGPNPAAETGDHVDNLADFYGGSAPDRGCHDRANGPPHYGQRVLDLGVPLDQRTEYWIKH